MKILHVITTLGTGGAEKLMVDLLPRLAADGHDVELAVFDGQRTPFYDQLLGRGIKVHSLGQGSVYSPRHILSLRKLIKHGHYDIVHTHNTACQLYGAMACVGFKKVCLFTTEHSTNNRRRGHWYWRTIDRWMYKRYHRVICISDIASTSLKEHLGKHRDNIITINNGVDIAMFNKATASDTLEHIAPGSRKIIMVAGFRWEKDQDTVIRAMTHLPDKFHLFLVGEGTRQSELQTLTDNMNVNSRVHFLGRRDDIPNLLHAADYIVMSSHFEGLSLSSVEGMSVGRPFLASDVNGLREVVAQAGILFPHSDDQALADVIISLDNSPEQYSLVANACLQRATQYDISKMVNGYLKIYINC
ncbi:MAG: glycosyltransferase [Muribaculaceae bacterium]|nr:glycosyltransferase [Muribaculaceae bacterium]